MGSWPVGSEVRPGSFARRHRQRKKARSSLLAGESVQSYGHCFWRERETRDRERERERERKKKREKKREREREREREGERERERLSTDGGSAAPEANEPL